ncbi:hypothetical protein, partial [Bacteroides sp.]|uniref:hypothetical protein n=1 Tax=Bacteroides sp. TaxID=29523 RepID=UPI0023C04479
MPGEPLTRIHALSVAAEAEHAIVAVHQEAMFVRLCVLHSPSFLKVPYRFCKCKEFSAYFQQPERSGLKKSAFHRPIPPFP